MPPFYPELRPAPTPGKALIKYQAKKCTKTRKPQIAIKAACQACRERKSKCDGRRPDCGKCVELHVECVWNTEIGETRLQSLKREHQRSQKQLDELRFLIKQLYSGSEDAKNKVLSQLASNIRSVDIVPDLTEIDSRVISALQKPHNTNAEYQKDIVTATHGSNTQTSTIVIRIEQIITSHITPYPAHSDCSTFSTRDFPPRSVKAESSSPINLPSKVPEWHYLLKPLSNTLRCAKTEDTTHLYKDNSICLPEAHNLDHFLIQANIRHVNKSDGLVSAVHQNLDCHNESAIGSFILSDDSQMANLFYSYREAAQSMLATGTPVLQVLGNIHQYDVELFFRDREPNDQYDADSWACTLLRSIEDFDLFVLLACCALYTSYMRWSILPTATHYALMAPMIRPTKNQQFVPHSMTIDLVPHPAMRQAVLQEPRDWLSSCTNKKGGTSVGWLHGLGHAVEIDTSTGRRILTDEFVQHATNPNNWSWNQSIIDMFPEIEALGFYIRHGDNG